ncbi:MAG TPA: family 43 glycosylhydrolase [Actinoplanes sp.]|nr:family 43 glycosylhydrolase [Actinoplanes sp.]
MRRAFCRAYAVLLLIVGSGAVMPGQAVAHGTKPAGRVAGDPVAHDPTVIRQGRYYYSFITGDIGTRTYLPMRRSADLVHWEFLGPVFSTPPAWVAGELGTTPGDFWAPDISYLHGEFRLYYAASSFGTNNSVIGLATNRTLDPASPDYGWVDRGMVLRSGAGDDFNAIDPEVIVDHGQPWLAFGSFWDGIKMRRLDPATGLAGDPELVSLASRGGASIEGASIVRHGKFFYLFASFDYCCRGVDSDYRVVVGRATRVNGPYVDRAGTPMLSGGGSEVLRGYNEFRGPGGGDVFGNFSVHHYYDLDDDGAPKLSVRPLRWTGGWPSLGDPLTGSRAVGHGPAYMTMVSRTDGRVVANPSCGYEGSDIALAAGPGGPCAQWRLDERDPGYVSLGNRFSNKVAEVAACVDADGARVAQWGWLHNDCQQFAIDPAGDGWAVIRSKLNGRVLQPAACTGDLVRTVAANGSACQQFRLQPVGEVLIADAGRTHAMAGWWRFEHAGDGYYRVVNTRSGRALPGGPWRIVTGGLVSPDGTATGGLVSQDGHEMPAYLATP